MTAQAMEKIIINGKLYSMATEPLYPYLKTLSPPLLFRPTNTACWRGYYGKWEIKNQQLFLIDLEGNTELGEITLDILFPGQTEVFANWFTGQLHIPHGKLKQYIHMGYESQFENNMFIEIKEGWVVEEKNG